jgi:chromosome segregation ATPase
MANEKLLATLQKTRHEIVEEWGRRSGRLQVMQSILEEARINLRRAQDEERITVQEDEDVKEKRRVLTKSITGLVDKPQYLLDKLSRLEAEQLETYRKRVAATEITRQRQRRLDNAETRLSVFQEDLNTSDRDLAEIDAQIRIVQGH